MEKNELMVLLGDYIKSVIAELSNIKKKLDNDSYRVYSVSSQVKMIQEHSKKSVSLLDVAQNSLGKNDNIAGLREHFLGIQIMTGKVLSQLAEFEAKARTQPSPDEVNYHKHLGGNWLNSMEGHLVPMLAACRALGMEVKKLAAALQTIS